MKASNMGYSTMRLMWIVLAYTNFAMRSSAFFGRLKQRRLQYGGTVR